MDETLDDFLCICAALAAEGHGPLVLATLVGTAGTSKSLGRRAWFLPGGEIRGSVTLGGCAEGQVRQAAAEVAASGEGRLLSAELGSGEAYEFGMTCSGQVEVLLQPASPADPVWQAARRAREAGEALALWTPLASGEGVRLLSAVPPVPAPPMPVAERQVDERGAFAALSEFWPAPFTLLIVGSGPVARPLSQLARTLGLRVTLTDDHPERARAQHFPDVHTLLTVPGGQEVQLPPLGERSAVVVLAHDYAQEVSVLTRVLPTPAPYVALLASRRRGAAVLQFLQDTGVPAAQLARVRTPAGLDLGLPSPAGIALSILTELVQVVQGGTARPLTAHAWAHPAGKGEVSGGIE